MLQSVIRNFIHFKFKCIIKMIDENFNKNLLEAFFFFAFVCVHIWKHAQKSCIKLSHDKVFFSLLWRWYYHSYTFIATSENNMIFHTPLEWIFFLRFFFRLFLFCIRVGWLRKCLDNWRDDLKRINELNLLWNWF